MFGAPKRAAGEPQAHRQAGLPERMPAPVVGPNHPFLSRRTRASGLRLKGKAFEFFFSLLIRPCQRAGNLFV